MTKNAVLAACALAAALSACSQAGTGLPPGASNASPASASHAAKPGTLKFEIRVPRHGRRVRHGRYVSPATKSIAISLAPSGGGAAITKNANVSGSTIEITTTLKPGSYHATVSTYDAQNEGGHVLSTGQSLPVKILSGKSNQVSLVLGGVPHAIAIIPDVAGGSQTAGFVTYGALALDFTILMTDADGYYIIGGGDPIFGFSATGTGWTVTPSHTSVKNPDRFFVTPPNVNGSVANVKIAMTDPALCTLAGSACNTSFTIKDVSQTLYVATCLASCISGTGPDTVAVFEAPYDQAPIATITNGIDTPQDVAVDKAGNVFVANNPYVWGQQKAPSVTEYSPKNGYSAPTATITSGLGWPERILVDASDDVIVSNFVQGGEDYLDVYTASSNYTAPPIVLAGYVGQITDMRINAVGTIVIASCLASCNEGGKDAIVEYAAPYSASETPEFFVAADPLSLTIDSHGNLWEGECGPCTLGASGVSEHAPEAGDPRYYSSSIINLADQNDGVYEPIAIAVNSSENVFETNSYNGNEPALNEYAAPPYSTPTSIFSNQLLPQQLRFDAADELVMNEGGASLYASLPPYTSYHPVVDEFNDAPFFGEADRFTFGP